MSSLSNIQYNSRSMNGLINVNANGGTFTDLEVNNLTVLNSGTAPTMGFSDNSTHIATTAFVQGHASGNYVDLSGTQSISGQKTFTNANTYFSGNLKSTSVATNYIDLDDGTSNEFMNIYSKNMNLNTTQSVGILAGGYTTFISPSNVYFNNATGTTKLVQINDTNNTALELQTATGTNTIRSYTNLSMPITGNIAITPSNSLSISVGNTGNINIGTGATYTGNINIGRVGATTNIPAITGKYIDLFAGQFRMFSASGGGSSIYTYVPPSGRTIVDYSSTNCDMVGQVNMTSNNITCSVAPTTGSEYCNKTYVDSVASSGTALLSSNNLWTGTNEFDNTVTNNMFVNNLDVVSFQNGAYFDNVCPYSTVAPSGAQDLVQKQYVDNSFVNLTGTQTISGSKTFNAFAVSQTAGTDISMSINNVSTDSIYLNFGTSQSLRMHYVNASNRLQINGTSTTKEVAIGANGNSYVIINPSTVTLTLNAPTTSVGGALTMQAGANFTFIPVGTINTSVVSTVPTGFLLCNGQAVSRSVYVNLFSAIGTTFGAGDGSTTFNVPDFEGAFLRGAGSQTVGGVTYTAPAIGTAQQDQVLSANYATNEGFRDCAGGTRECVSRSRITGDPVDTNTGILAQFARQGTENRPFNYSVYYYIKF